MTNTSYTFDSFPPSSPTVTGLFIAYLSIYFLILITCSILLIPKWRRTLPVFSLRSPPSLLFCQFFVFVCTVVVVVTFILGKTESCYLLQGVTLVFFPFGILPMFLRMPDFVVASELNSLKITRSNGDEKHWMWKLRFLLWTPTKLAIICSTCLLEVAVFVPLRFNFDLPGDCARLAYIVQIAFLLIFYFILGWFLLRLFRYNDPLFLRVELMLTSLLNTPFATCVILYPIYPWMFPPSFDFRFILAFPPFLICLMNFVYPILLTFPLFGDMFSKKERLSGSDQIEMKDKEEILTGKQGTDIFQAVLDNPILCEAFSTFAVQTWSVENLLFYKAAEKFSKNFNPNSPSEMKAAANHLIREYLETRAPLEVNLDFTAKKEILGKLEAGQIDAFLFVEAQNRIFDLMKSDTFEKWRLTLAFKEALTAAVARAPLDI